MSNEVVKYHNELNKLSMRDWTPEEMDFFFSIVWKVKNKGVRRVEIGTDELKSLANFSQKNNTRFEQTLKRLVDHILELRTIVITKKGTRFSMKGCPFFTEFNFEWEKDLSEMNGYVQVSEHFQYFVNELKANFTSWELKEFTQLRSTYAKTAYRHLKQYRTKGERVFDIEEFKMLFGIPKSYRAADINRRVFKPILTELKPYFLDLKITPVKKRTHGNPIIEYKFTFHPTLPEKWDEEKYDKKKLATSQRVKRKKNANNPTWYDDKETHQASDELVQQALEVQKSRKEQQ
mgnify:CR=1 FL=1